jgi:hypothetical protein
MIGGNAMIRLIPIFALLLASCATLTPERCARIDAAASTAQEIAAVLIAQGIEPVKAQKLADAVKAGQIVLAAACAQANPVRP